MVGLIDKLPDPHECYMNMPWPELEFVSREEWGALPPTGVVEYESHPIKQVIIGYTETDRCEDKESCIRIMQELQRKHMAEGHSDIRFNFVVGWDERVYVGRGINAVPGKHPRYPQLEGKSVEVVLTGQRGELPKPGIKSSIMYILIDKYSFNNGPISFEESNYHLDYEDTGDDCEQLKLQEAQEVSDKANEVLEPYRKMFYDKYYNTIPAGE